LSCETSETPKGLRSVRADFPSLARTFGGVPLAFFDGPGGTQVPRPVIEAIADYYSTRNANTHGHFVTSRESDLLLEEARAAAALFLNAPATDSISLGANMTTLAFSLSHALGRAFSPGDEVAITQLDHEANRGPWLRLRERGMVVREVRMLPGGTLDYDDLRRKVTERTRLVAVGWASNVLGTVNDLAEIRRVSREVGAWLLVDAVHYAPHFAVDVGAAEVDFLLCSAYKFYGPHVGILYCRPNLLGQLDPDRLRTQDCRAPYRIETGTLNHAAIAGVKAAVEYIARQGVGDTPRKRIESAMGLIGTHEHVLARRFYEGLSALEKVRVFGPPFGVGPRAPTVSFRVGDLDPAAVADRLGEAGLLVWDGDFYAARAVEALGLADRGGLVRVGMSLYNTGEEVERLLEVLGGTGG
jgi:cysteine desulfurase family protein (TIGR01976 family)